VYPIDTLWKRNGYPGDTSERDYVHIVGLFLYFINIKIKLEAILTP
jgi:hypothetical protein